MTWQKIGGDGGRLGIYAWVPDRGGLEPPGPPPPADTPTPPANPFFTDGSNIECELGLVYPCLERSKARARWMLQWQECNCDDVNEPVAVCDRCFLWLLANLDEQQTYSTCSGCGLMYGPPRAIIRDVVKLP